MKGQGTRPYVTKNSYICMDARFGINRIIIKA